MGSTAQSTLLSLKRQRVKIENSREKYQDFPSYSLAEVPHQVDRGHFFSKVGKTICPFHTHSFIEEGGAWQEL